MRSTRSTGSHVASAITAAVLLVLAACSSSDDSPRASGLPGGGTVVGLRGAAPVALQAEQDCAGVLEDFQAIAPDVLTEQLAFQDVGAPVARDGDAAVAEAAGGSDDAGVAGSAPTAAADAAGGDGGGASSETNTQEEGIDEPDVVETDGDLVYLVDQDELVILDGVTAAIVGRVRLATHGAQIMRSGDRLLAISGGGGYGIAVPGVAVDAVEEPALVDPEVGQDGGGVDPVPAPDEPVASEPVPVEPGPQPVEPEPDPVPLPEPLPVEPPSFPVGTVIQLVDVSDPAAPTVVQTTELEGNHVSTRVVDGVARVVITSYPQPPVMFEGPVPQGDGADDAIRERAAATEVDDWLPSFRTVTASSAPEATTTSEGTAVACEDVLMPEVNAGVAETTILRVDFEDGFDPADSTTIVAEAGTVYASASTLYVAANRWVEPAGREEVSSDDWSTAVHAFDLRGDGPAAHVGAGEVPGTTLNQYSLSEHDGHLRIATTEGTPWDGGSESESAVRVLRLEGGELVEVGAVGGLGRTETIQSVRFMGPVGYVVTFRQTDPLYVIDLSDPTRPQAVGELKIPGFSSYLHPVGEGRLLGIGRDATTEGVDQGVLVSLFDVSDPTQPRQLQTWTQRDAWSMAGDDPKAFLWWAPQSAAVVPLERYGQPSAGLPDGYASGMVVLDVADTGITERAMVTASGRYASRALVVQGRLWSLFDGGVVTSDFADPAGGTFHPLR